jgi:spoIIIJ-associated protein
VATDEDAEELADIVNEILDIAELQAKVQPTSLNGRYVNMELDGRDVAYLVGKHGEILNAFQYLVNIIASRQLESGVRVTLDGNNYRRRREEALCNLALQIAEQVRERGEEAVLDALPAFERRIVHKAISEFDGVSTYSEGEEPNRRVVIAPAE